MILLITISCSKSKEDEVVVNAASISGKWYYKEIVVNGTIFPYDGHETCGKDYIDFFGTNSIKSIDVFNCEEITDWIGTYSKNGKTLIINNGSETINAEIIELTANSLIYKFNYDIDGNGTIDANVSKYDR